MRALFGYAILVLLGILGLMARAATFTAPLTGTATGGGSGTACTHGPNAPSVPLPAQRAGFTTCVMNADFTSTTTDAGGINYSNTATFVVQCGASYASDHSAWDVMWGTGGNVYSGGAPCARTQVGVGLDPLFPSTQALDEKFLRADFSSNVNLISMEWPGFCCSFASPAGTSIYQYLYFQITFRAPSSTVSQAAVNNNGGAIPIDVWQEEWTPNHTDTEVDFFEIQPAFNSGTQYRLSTNINSLNNPFASFRIDYNDGQYHTAGYLITSDGSSQMSVCAYIDGGIATATPYGPCGVVTGLSSGALNQWANNLALWLGSFNCSSPASLCLANDIDFYVRDIQLWMCSTPFTAACFGTVITSSAEEPKKYATWRDRVFEAIKSWLISPAFADVFDAPIKGMWACPDGKLGVHAECEPPELLGKSFWESCVPGRNDCVTSPSAFIGWDREDLNHAKRGRGFCYTEHPYTCSPDGKMR